MSDAPSLPRSSSRGMRHAAKYLQKENAKWPDTLKPWPREQWPNDMAGAPGVIAVFRSKGFLVQVFGEPGPVVVRLSVLRTAIKRDGSWQEGISWEELQRIKRECGYGDFDAVEVYPPDADVANVANMRHLWVLPRGHLPFAWRKS